MVNTAKLYIFFLKERYLLKESMLKNCKCFFYNLRLSHIPYFLVSFKQNGAVLTNLYS